MRANSSLESSAAIHELSIPVRAYSTLRRRRVIFTMLLCSVRIVTVGRSLISGHRMRSMQSRGRACMVPNSPNAEPSLVPPPVLARSGLLPSRTGKSGALAPSLSSAQHTRLVLHSFNSYARSTASVTHTDVGLGSRPCGNAREGFAPGRTRQLRS